MSDVPDKLAAKPARQRGLADLGTSAFPSSGLERNMAELTESLPGAVFQIAADQNRNVRYTYASGRAREVLGLEPAAILADPLATSRLVLPEYSARLFDAYQGSLQSMRPFSVDVRIKRPDGALRWVRTVRTPGAAGDGFLWNGYWYDVTEELEARSRLEDAEPSAPGTSGRAADPGV